MYRVILVDDDKWALADIRNAFPFARFGFEVAAMCESAEEAEEAFARLLPEVLITDIQMKRRSGLDLLAACKKKREDVVAIMLSGHDSFDYARQSLNGGAYYYMLKPVNEEEAAELLQRVYLLLSSRAPGDTVDEDDFARMLRYVSEHLSPSLSLDELSERFCFNRTYISEMFTARIGIPFSQYKKKLYAQRAQEILRRPGARVADATEALDFGDTRYFSRVFKEMTGMTPRAYQLLVREEPSREE